MVSGHGSWVSSHAYAGTIRIDSGDARPATECTTSDWKGFQVSTFQCADVLCQGSMSQRHNFGRTVNQIGRDRTCHEFSGSIAELLVFSEPLSLCEVEYVERYLALKYCRLLGEEGDSLHPDLLVPRP